MALNQDDDAQRAFIMASSLANEGGLIPVQPYALTGLAALESCQQASPGTLELILFILQHAASAQKTKNWVAQLRAEVEAKLSKEQIEAVEQSNFTKQLDAFVHHALNRI